MDPSLNKISQRFINGLEEYNLTYDEVKDWKYCGGQGEDSLTLEEQLVHKKHRSRIAYFRLCFPNRELPPYKYECICGHDIKDNCFITNGTDILVIGNCCNKRFIKNCNKTCERCTATHRNRKNNLCNNCRQHDKDAERDERNRIKNLCARCQFNNKEYGSNTCRKCTELEEYEYKEYLKSLKQKCKDCDKIITGSYKRCYQCNIKHCNQFKTPQCKKCGIIIDEKYDMCYKCNNENKTGKCIKCNTNINSKYTTCFNCR